MVAAAFVAPFLPDVATRLREATGTLADVRSGLLSREPLSLLALRRIGDGARVEIQELL